MIQEKKQKIFSSHDVQIRLQQVVSKCLSLDDSDFYFVFEKEHNRLIFHFDQGVDRDPEFSGPVQAVLYLDKKNNLSFSYTSLENLEKVRKEILASNISSLSFSFFYEGHLQWSSSFPSDKLPIMMKIKVEKENFLIDYAYIFPQYHPIKYGSS